jgi:hypothetical protein
MALRSTMTALITRLRRLIGDPAGSSQTWQDEDLQDALDHHRREARYAYLRPVETIAQGGAITYLTYAADMPDWEGEPSLADGNYAALTADTEDLLTGRWTFATEPQRPVRITGWYYDLHGAGAEVLTEWLGLLKTSNAGVDFTADGLTVKRSQKIDHLTTLLNRCAAQQWADSGAILQTDFTPSARHYGGNR